MGMYVVFVAAAMGREWCSKCVQVGFSKSRPKCGDQQFGHHGCARRELLQRPAHVLARVPVLHLPPHQA